MDNNRIVYFHSLEFKIEIIYCKDCSISYPEHNHISDYIIGIILNGKLHLKIKDRIKYYTPNDSFIIYPYEPHEILADGQIYTMISICINKQLFQEYDFKNIQLILLNLVNILEIESTITFTHYQILLDAINMLYHNINHSEQRLNKSITIIKDFLEQKPEMKMNLEQLSQKIFISKYHFIREFKKIVGLTPHRFQMQNRIRKAQHLLEKNNCITEVALATGFCDQSHFIKWFKHIVRLTPTKYLEVQVNPFTTHQISKVQEKI